MAHVQTTWNSISMPMVSCNAQGEQGGSIFQRHKGYFAFKRNKEIPVSRSVYQMQTKTVKEECRRYGIDRLEFGPLLKISNHQT